MDKCVNVPVLIDWIYNLPDKEFHELTGSSKSQAARGTDDEFDITYFLSETAPKFETWLKEQGLYLMPVKNGITYLRYNPDHFENINTACQGIMADYDDDFDTLRNLGCFPPYRDAQGEPTPESPWGKWELGGDDDVDYNGGYITIVLDVLIAYERREQ